MSLDKDRCPVCDRPTVPLGTKLAGLLVIVCGMVAMVAVVVWLAAEAVRAV